MRFKMRKLAELNLIIYDIYLILNSNTDFIKEFFDRCLLAKIIETHLKKKTLVFRFQTDLNRIHFDEVE